MGIVVGMNTLVLQGALAVDQTWTSGNNKVAVPYTVDTIAADVTPLKDKPLWPLSSYGPAKHEPVIIGGLDESPEELRLKAATALKAGTSDEYTRYEGQKTAAADQMYANARDNVKQLYDQALKASTQADAPGPSFAAPVLTTSAPSAFGASSTPSPFGSTGATAFGKPAFGQPAFSQTGFGNSTGSTSAPSQAVQGTSTFSAFGQPSQATSTFGQTTQPTSVFGQSSQTPSVFGQTTQPTSAFGQTSQSSPAFGQSSVFGATSQSASAFGQPSKQPTSVFGKPSQPSSVFGQSSQPTSTFGQPSLTSAFGQSAQSTSAFSQPSQPASGFGQPTQPAFGQSSLIKPASGAFGGLGGGGFSAFASQPSTLSSATAPTSPAMSTTPTQSAFGSTQSAFGAVPSAPKSAFGTSQQTPFGFGDTLSISALPSSLAAGGTSPFATSPMPITPSSEKQASGAPDFASAKLTVRMKPGADRYLGLLPGDYNELMPADIKAAFTNAKFEWGKIPDWIPPESVR